MVMVDIEGDSFTMELGERELIGVVDKYKFPRLFPQSCKC
jgi:hypothetical protein